MGLFAPELFARAMHYSPIIHHSYINFTLNEKLYQLILMSIHLLSISQNHKAGKVFGKGVGGAPATIPIQRKMKVSVASLHAFA